MRPDLARQLAALGVHVVPGDTDSLVRLFPSEFRMAEAGLDDSDIAEVFLAFVRRGLISLASSMDMASVAQRSAARHVCHFYRERDEMIGMVATFLAEGLRGGERCLWVCPAWLAPETARAALRATRQGLDDAEAADRARILVEDDVYFDDVGALRSADGIIDFWISQERDALASGFRGLRIAGDGTGLVSVETWTSGVEYERNADAAFVDRRIAALCTYSLSDVSPDRLAEVLTGHACGHVHRAGAWDEIRPGPGVAKAIALLQAVR